MPVASGVCHEANREWAVLFLDLKEELSTD